MRKNKKMQSKNKGSFFSSFPLSSLAQVQNRRLNEVFSGIITLFVLFSLTACNEPIPIESMGKAKMKITKAETVKADEYAPEDYENAKKALLKSHELISQEKMKEAKDEAEKAQKLADKAFGIAVPKLAEETKENAEEKLATAEELYAEEFASSEFLNAQKAVEKGDQQYFNKKYFESYQTYELALEEAEKAINISEIRSEEIKRELAEVQVKINKAKKIGASESAPDMLKMAEEKANNAKMLFDDKKLKKAYLALEEAKAHAIQALSVSLSDWAKKKLIEAEAALTKSNQQMEPIEKKIKESPSLLSIEPETSDRIQSSRETFVAARESLANSKKSLEEELWEKSYVESEESIRLSRIVDDQLEELSVLLATADERLLKQKKIEEKVEKTEKKPEEKIEKTKLVNKSKPKSFSDDGWKTYKVRLLPGRRDCLWRIAGYEHIYNNSRKWSRIYKANRSKIKNPDLIYPGQVFDIPPIKSKSLKKPELLKPKIKKSSETSIKKEKPLKEEVDEPAEEFIIPTEEPSVSEEIETNIEPID